MNEIQVEINELKAKLELYHWSLSHTDNTEHAVILRKAIEQVQARIDELEK